MTSVVLGKNSDFVGMLGELGKEQKFEVTYVEVEEKNDEDQIQCLVQLSTLPVAVNINKKSSKPRSMYIYFNFISRFVMELEMRRKQLITTLQEMP